MKLFVDNNFEGICIEVKRLSVLTNLTFCTVNSSIELQNVLLKLLKKGLVNSFEVAGEELKVSFYTKYVKEIG